MPPAKSTAWRATTSSGVRSRQTADDLPRPHAFRAQQVGEPRHPFGQLAVADLLVLVDQGDPLGVAAICRASRLGIVWAAS